MKKNLLFLLMILPGLAVMAQGYEVGDKASDFNLLGVDGEYVSMSDYPDAEGFIVIFSCNHCPYVKAYEDRMIELHNEFAPQGYPVIAINPNDPEVQPEDSYELMQQRAEEINFPFPYLVDETQEVYQEYGATRTPHVYLLEREGGELRVAYIGAIDDNYQDASKVQETYVADAIEALKKGQEPDTQFTKAIGCSIKTKE